MQQKLEVYLPYDKSTIGQRFGDNATSLYASQGLKGHTAYDWTVPYGTPIPNCVENAYCYSLMHVKDPILMDYRAVFFIVETETGVYEVSYGHVSEFVAEVGKTYQVGDTIAKVGNTGPVFVGQHEVTEAEKDAGSTAGSHLHGPQIRVLAKTKYTNTYKNYITVESGNKYVDKDGMFYGIPDYDNGYNGCVSLASFSQEKLATKANYDADHTVATTIASEGQILAQVASLTQQVSNLPTTQQKQYVGPLQAIINAIKSIFS